MERSFKLRLISTLSFTLGTILIIGIVVFYLGFDISRKGTLILSTNTKLLQARNNISDLAKLKEQEKEADIALFKLNNALPKRDSLFSVSRDLEDLAKRRSLSFGSKFKEEVSATNTQPGYIGIDMNLSGSYNDLVAFIRDLDVGSYSINVVSFDIVRQGSGFSGLITGELFFSD